MENDSGQNVTTWMNYDCIKNLHTIDNLNSINSKFIAVFKYIYQWLEMKSTVGFITLVFIVLEILVSRVYKMGQHWKPRSIWNDYIFMFEMHHKIPEFYSCIYWEVAFSRYVVKIRIIIRTIVRDHLATLTGPVVLRVSQKTIGMGDN